MNVPDPEQPELVPPVEDEYRPPVPPAACHTGEEQAAPDRLTQVEPPVMPSHAVEPPAQTVPPPDPDPPPPISVNMAHAAPVGVVIVPEAPAVANT